MITRYKNPRGTDQPPIGKLVIWWTGFTFTCACRIRGNKYFVGIWA